MTAQSLREHDRDQVVEASQVKEVPVLERSPDDLAGVDFLKLKAGVRATCTELLAELTGPKGFKWTISGLWEQLKEGSANMIDLPHDTEALLTNIMDVAANVITAENKLDRVKRTELADEQRVLSSCSDKVGALRDMVREQVDSMRYKVGQLASQKRSDYQTKYWMQTKAGNWLSAGGHGKKFAKFLAPLIYLLADAAKAENEDFMPQVQGVLSNPKATEFDSSRMAIWSPTFVGSEEFPFTGFMKSFDAAKPGVDVKMDALLNGCGANPRWTGSFGNVPKVFMDEKVEGVGTFSGFNHDGACLWMTAIMQFAKRFGSSGYTLPGGAQLFLSITNVVYVHMAPLGPALQAGIAIADLEAYYEANSGKDFLNDYSVLLRVPVGGAFFIPFGWVGNIVFFKDADMLAGKTQAKKDFSLVNFECCPVTFPNHNPTPPHPRTHTHTHDVNFVSNQFAPNAEPLNVIMVVAICVQYFVQNSVCVELYLV